MWRELRSALVGLVTVGVLVGLGPAVAAASSDANRQVRVSGTSPFTGWVFDYADDVAMSAGSDGVVHLSAHVFDVDRQRSGLLATRSTDGGRTWGRPVALAVRTGSRGGEYAGGTIAADPADPRLVYGVVPTG